LERWWEGVASPTIKKYIFNMWGYDQLKETAPIRSSLFEFNIERVKAKPTVLYITLTQFNGRFVQRRQAECPGKYDMKHRD